MYVVINLLYDTYPKDKYVNINFMFKSGDLPIVAIAYAQGGNIIYGLKSILDFYNKNGLIALKNEIIGVTMHEFTHIYQYARFSNKIFVEAVAEYVRISSGFISGWSGERGSLSPIFNMGYGSIPAYFLLNTDQKYPGFIKMLNLNFNSSSDTNIVARTITGDKHQTIDSIWLEYQRGLMNGEMTKIPIYLSYNI